MAAKTQGFALSAMPRSPAIPNNVGAVDVKAIYDGVRQGLAAFENVRRAPASMALADAEMEAKTLESPMGTALAAEEVKRAPLKTAILAAEADPATIAAKRAALTAKAVRPLTGTPYLLQRMDELRTALAANPTDPTITQAIGETQALLNKASATSAADPNAANASREKVAEINAGAAPKSGRAALIRELITQGYDDDLIEKVILKDAASSAADPEADRRAKAESERLKMESTERIAEKRDAATIAAKKATFDAKRLAGEPKVRSALEAAENQTARIDGLVDTAISKIGLLTTGFGAALANLPDSDARSLREDLSTIKANLGFNELNQMRQNSPTGGALGNVTERELDFLQKTIASLDQYLDGDDLKQRLETVREEVKASWGRVKRAYDRDFGATRAAAPVPQVPAPVQASPEEKAAAQSWLDANPNDPRAPAVRAKAGL